MGYVIFGLAFTVIVYFRNMNQNKHEEKIAKHLSNNNVNTGIPEEYELFYAMAASSIGEGVLSACYHVCPTGVNFQFDTTFMYIMSVLIFLKVFQFRHSDLTPSPHATYLFISFILVVEVTGYFAYETIAYWTIFTFCYLFIVYYVIMNFSSNKGSKGIFRFLYDTIEIVWHPEEWSLACLQIKPIKLVLLVNICLAGYFLSQARIMYQASTYILLILMSNMQMYFLYYIYCKHWYYYKEKMEGESIKWFTWLYGALAVVCCVFAGKAYYKCQALFKSKDQVLNFYIHTIMLNTSVTAVLPPRKPPFLILSVIFSVLLNQMLLLLRSEKIKNLHFYCGKFYGISFKLCCEIYVGLFM